MSGYIGYRKVPTILTGGGIWTLGEQAKFRKDVVWPSLNDPYFSSVSLLLHFDGANNSTTFTDSSSNAHTITRFGDAKISTTQSKFGESSGYFDGSGDYCEFANHSSLNLDGDFTIELWCYNLSSASALKFIAAKFVGGFSFYLNTSNKLAFAQDNVLELVVSSGAVSTNQWVHLAVSRNGTTIKLFVDGANDGTATSSANLTSTNSGRIGSAFNGYIDELRITKGVARYTSNFTPPAAPFTNY